MHTQSSEASARTHAFGIRVFYRCLHARTHFNLDPGQHACLRDAIQLYRPLYTGTIEFE